VGADLDTLATAPYVTIDDLLTPHRGWHRGGRRSGSPKLSHAELVTLAVLQALLGFPSEARCCATPTGTFATCSPTCPASRATTSACAARPNSSAMPSVRWPATARCGATTWVIDSTPVECGRSRETARRSALAG
jgi:hypothetical protein